MQSPVILVLPRQGDNWLRGQLAKAPDQPCKEAPNSALCLGFPGWAPGESLTVGLQVSRVVLWLLRRPGGRLGRRATGREGTPSGTSALCHSGLSRLAQNPAGLKRASHKHKPLSWGSLSCKQQPELLRRCTRPLRSGPSTAPQPSAPAPAGCASAVAPTPSVSPHLQGTPTPHFSRNNVHPPSEGLPSRVLAPC